LAPAAFGFCFPTAQQAARRPLNSKIEKHSSSSAKREGIGQAARDARSVAGFCQLRKNPLW
jgi:hypothetical protein